MNLIGIHYFVAFVEHRSKYQESTPVTVYGMTPVSVQCTWYHFKTFNVPDIKQIALTFQLILQIPICNIQHNSVKLGTPNALVLNSQLFYDKRYQAAYKYNCM